MLLSLLCLALSSSVLGCKTPVPTETPCPQMSDTAICQWIALRETDVVPEQSSLNHWLGRLINHCAWEPREEPLVCPEEIHVPPPVKLK